MSEYESVPSVEETLEDVTRNLCNLLEREAYAVDLVAKNPTADNERLRTLASSVKLLSESLYILRPQRDAEVTAVPDVSIRFKDKEDVLKQNLHKPDS